MYLLVILILVFIGFIFFGIPILLVFYVLSILGTIIFIDKKTGPDVSKTYIVAIPFAIFFTAVGYLILYLINHFIWIKNILLWHI